jgi:excisionase family DNA binding protein
MPRPPRLPSTTHHTDHPRPTSTELQVYTPAEAAERLKVRESWLRRKAAERQVACTFVGKHLRFSAADIAEIITAGTTPPTGRKPRRRTPTTNRSDDLPTPPQRSVHAHRDDPDPDGSNPWHG